MLRRFSANFAVFSIFVDAFLIAFGLLVATVTRHLFSPLSFVQDIPIPIWTPLELYFTFPVIWVAVLLLFSVYDGRKNLRVVDEYGSLTLGTGLAAVAMAGILYFSYRDISRFLFVEFVLISWVFMLLWRAVYRVAYRMRMFGTSRDRNILILGAGQIGRSLWQQITDNPHLGLSLIGYLDDDTAKIKSNPDILGSLDTARQVILDRHVHDVMIALPMNAHQRLNQIVAELHDLPVRVWVVPDYFALTLHKAQVEEIAGIPMLNLRAPALNEDQRMVKRTFDLALTIFSLPILILLFGAIALAIKLDSPGSVFYKSKRVGEGGRIFSMYKFRTMVVDADKMQDKVSIKDADGNVIHKRPDDPRVTKVGRFLRRSSLDEIPQLINVLLGEMSIVGPRPEMPYLVDRYEVWQRKRFAVPQGMTGWWQINGRSDKPMHLNTQDDLYYVQHYSIWLDIQILMKSVWVILKGKGAY